MRDTGYGTVGFGSGPRVEAGLVPVGLARYRALMSLFIIHVAVHVKPGAAGAFRVATLDNARNSRLEPGVVRFDLLQVADQPDRFVLVEIYRDAAAAAAHKETAHYLRWRDAVGDLMAEPRSSTKFVNLDPGDDGWD